TNKKMRRNRFK
nr:Chain B, HNF1 beta A splice variant 2 [Homo sapiens]5K9S_C Chain C, HNF1 beta A splice variant 2 [Homo sapiens]